MFTQVLVWQVHTFKLYVGVALLVSLGIIWLVSEARRPLDVAVGMMWGGFALARAEYVLFNWDLFAPNPSRVLDMGLGGLGWHGAVLGALLVLWGATRMGWGHSRPLLAALAPALPLLALAAWSACRPLGCAYGIEVETLAFYPAWAVTEGPDIFGIIAPRYDTHRYGQVLAWGLLAGVGAVWLGGRATPRLSWLALAVWSAGMFGIGFARGDYAPQWGPLRAGQWLDLMMLAFALVMLWRPLAHRPLQSSPPPGPGPLPHR